MNMVDFITSLYFYSYSLVFLALPSGLVVAVPVPAEVGGTGAAVGTEVGAEDVVVVVAIIIATYLLFLVFVINLSPNLPLYTSVHVVRPPLIEWWLNVNESSGLRLLVLCVV